MEGQEGEEDPAWKTVSKVCLEQVQKRVLPVDEEDEELVLGIHVMVSTVVVVLELVVVEEVGILVMHQIVLGCYCCSTGVWRVEEVLVVVVDLHYRFQSPPQVQKTVKGIVLLVVDRHLVLLLVVWDEKQMKMKEVEEVATPFSCDVC